MSDPYTTPGETYEAPAAYTEPSNVEILLQQIRKEQETTRKFIITQLQKDAKTREETYGPVRNLVKFINLMLYLQLGGIIVLLLMFLLSLGAH